MIETDIILISHFHRTALVESEDKIHANNMVNFENDDERTIPRKLSYVIAMTENQTNAVMASDVIKDSSVNDGQPLETIPMFSMGKIYKNLILLSLAFVLMFSAYNGMVILQSSLNVKNNVGVNSLIITYTFLIV